MGFDYIQELFYYEYFPSDTEEYGSCINEDIAFECHLHMEKYMWIPIVTVEAHVLGQFTA